MTQQKDVKVWEIREDHVVNEDVQEPAEGNDHQEYPEKPDHLNILHLVCEDQESSN